MKGGEMMTGQTNERIWEKGGKCTKEIIPC
jgi:hypothetical protein